MAPNTCDNIMKLVIAILAAFSVIVKGESCTAPDRGNGTCVSIRNCQTLAALVTKASRTQGDVDLLKKVACGLDGTTPKVCCQQTCYTPEGLPGNCVDIKECPHLASKVKRPLADDVIAYLRSTRCNGATHHSVCCGPNISPYDQNYCKNQNFISPPNLNTECCGKDSNGDKIIRDGDVARLGQYPWMALIEHEKDGEIKLLCGGNLISSKYVLTTAHCIVGPVLKSGTPKNVRLGEFDTSNDDRDCEDYNGSLDCADKPVTIPIERSIAHPDYDRTTMRNDIALIRMKNNAPYTDFVRPICLPATDVTINPPKYIRLIAAGWGAVNETIRRSALKLHVTLPLVDNQKCQESFSALSAPGLRTSIWNKQVCAGGVKNRDSCKGDSGGPLMYFIGHTGRYELIGLVSFNVKPCGAETVPGVYTKVFEYNSWIRNTISLWN